MREGELAETDDQAALGEISSLVALNDTGNIAFTADLVTGIGEEVTEENGNALFIYLDGALEVVAREGDVIEVLSPDNILEERTISFINFRDTGISDTALAFELEFTDGTSGIFTTAVPEPSTAMLTAGLALFVMRRRQA